MAPSEQVAVLRRIVSGRTSSSKWRSLSLDRWWSQAGEDGAVGVGEGRLADLALQDEELVSEREDLDVLVGSLIVSRRRNAKALIAVR